MQELKKEGTDFTPAIFFDPNSQVFEISGVSRPEHVMGFYQPLIDWLVEFEKKVLDGINAQYQVDSIRMIFKMVYFNSASAKSILQMLNLLKKFQQKGIKVLVDWYYDEGDEQMREDGEDLADAVELNFNYIEIE